MPLSPVESHRCIERRCSPELTFSLIFVHGMSTGITGTCQRKSQFSASKKYLFIATGEKTEHLTWPLLPSKAFCCFPGQETSSRASAEHSIRSLNGWYFESMPRHQASLAFKKLGEVSSVNLEDNDTSYFQWELREAVWNEAGCDRYFGPKKKRTRQPSSRLHAVCYQKNHVENFSRQNCLSVL